MGFHLLYVMNNSNSLGCVGVQGIVVETNVGLYTCECMVSIININSGIREPTRGYQNYNTSQLLIFGVYVKARESLDT